MFRRRRPPGSHRPPRSAARHRKGSPSPDQDRRQTRFRSPTVQSKFPATHGTQPLLKAPEKDVGLRPASPGPVGGGTQRIVEVPHMLLQKHELPAIGGAQAIGPDKPGVGGTQQIGTKGGEPPRIQKPDLSSAGGSHLVGGKQYLPQLGVGPMVHKDNALGTGTVPKLLAGNIASAVGKTGNVGSVVVDHGYEFVKSAGPTPTPKGTVAGIYETLEGPPGTMAGKAPVIPQTPVTVDTGYDTVGGHHYSNVQPKNEVATPVTVIQGKLKNALFTSKTGKVEILAMKPKTLPSTPSTVMVEPIDSRLVTTSPPRSMAMKTQSQTVQQPKPADYRRYQKPVLIVVGIILIAAIIGGIIYAAQPSKETGVYKGPAATFTEGYCSKVRNGISPKCVLGSPPSRSCTSGVCTVMSYAVSHYGILWTLTDMTSSTNHDNIQPGVNSHPLICRRDDNVLGACSKEGLCDRIYAAKPHRLWESNATWEDNCDEPNECWNNTVLMKLLGGTTREDCNNNTTDAWACPAGASAVVWMQHLRCKTGSNRTTARPCQGLPLKLWRCAKCRQVDPPSILCRAFQLVGQCHYTCGGRYMNNLPDGAKCIYDGDSSKEAYCYYGRCFPAGGFSKKLVKDKATCLAEREYDEKQS